MKLPHTILSFTALLAVASAALPAATGEYQLKAVFLFNFIQFVEWPAPAQDAPPAPLCVGVLGTDPFGPTLDAVMQGEQIDGRPIVVERYNDVAQLEHCDLLFIGQHKLAEVRATLERLKGRPILTVGESAEFIEAGGIVRFVKQSNKIRLQVNLRAADEAQLRLSSKLLRSSQIVAQAETEP